VLLFFSVQLSAISSQLSAVSSQLSAISDQQSAFSSFCESIARAAVWGLAFSGQRSALNFKPPNLLTY
jgi:TPP-dependent indolepyruvate ferredoxin oxidoreductase alpha subunit